MISQQIKEFDSSTTTKAYFNTLPMDQIFPDDLSQHILNFSGPHHTKTIERNGSNYQKMQRQII